MNETTTEICTRCNSPLPQYPKGRCGGTGYALIDGKRVCYPCAGELERARIESAQPDDKLTAYLSSDGRTVTAWSGGVLMDRVALGELHPWSRERRYLSAYDPKGRKWSGIGAEGMWTNLKLCK